MPITVACSDCNARFEIADDLGGQSVRCHHCGQPCRADTGRSHAFQAGRTPPGTALLDEMDPAPTPRRPTARPPFPWGPIAIITIGILFLLLGASVMINVYFFTTQPNRFRHLEEAMRAEQMAMQARMEADKARQLALANEEQARLQEALAKRRLDEIQEKLDAAGKQFDANAQPAQPEWGTLEGRVTWTGNLPKVEDLEPKIRNHRDAAFVLSAPKELLRDPIWRIDPKTKGVANVCVFLKRPKNDVLPIHADDKVRKAPVVIDAPFLIFEPHIVAVYPEWFDGKQKGKTGQALLFKNSTKDYSYTARGVGDPNRNPGFNLLVQPDKALEAPVQPQKLPILVNCNLHVWMQGYVWCFDHPYFAITKADGSFTIPRVPAGMEVQVMGWHEGEGWLFTKELRTMSLKAGKNILDFEMSAK